MTTNKSTKRALLSSALALLVCFAMLLGTTFAWFTDEVTSSANKIVSGTLKVDLELLDKDTNAWASIKNNKAPLFNYDKWEPGFIDAKVLKVENEGTLALKWKAKFVSAVELSELADVIDVYVLAWGVRADDNVADVKYPENRDLTAANYVRVGTVREFVNTIESTTYGNLLEGESAYLGIALKMQESAGNTYQKKTLGAFDIQIVATQMASENDSFGNDYDAGADFDGEISTTKNVVDTTVVNTIDSGDIATLNIPVGAPAGSYMFRTANKKVTTDEGTGAKIVSIDLTLERDGVKVTDDGVTKYTVEIDVGTNQRIIEVLHNGYSVDEFTYDENSGILTLTTASFSPFVFISEDIKAVTELKGTGTESDPYLINNYFDLCWFRDHVNTCAQDGSSQYTGKYIKLTSDINLSGVNWEPIGSTTKDHGSFYGIFDGDGHTIYNLTVSLESGQGAAGFFAKVSGGGDGPRAVVKNITFENVDVYSPDSYVGGVVGNAGGNSEIRNVTVKGEIYISGYGYVGGIVGHGYPDMYDCHIEGDGEYSYIMCNYWCGGGIIGYAGEGGTYLENCSAKNIYIWSAYGAAGGLVGLLQYNNTVKDCYAENVIIELNSPYVCGYACGNGEESVYSNVSVKNVTVTYNETELKDIPVDGTGYHNCDNKDLIFLD